ncbi:UNVERIFIED_CONTAM: hypothetical protein FKN15_007170, partial [Acipenser sinensis]
VPSSIRDSDEVSQLTVTEGSLITLVCESSGIPPPSLTWKKNGAVLKADSRGRVRVLSGGRQLQISSAEKSDAASYSCVASNMAGDTMKEYNLQVYVRPTILNSGSRPSNVTVTRRNDVTLECEVQGIPRPTVTWLKDGRPLVNGRGVLILNEGRLLQIKNSQVSDTGRYMCVAMNVAGQADRKYDVNVHVPPSISGDLKSPENVSVVVKNPVALSCEASGIPLPAITWLKDGRPISLSNSIRILSGGRLLRLMHAAVEDAGRYTCVVSNTAGEERKNFDLEILVPPSIGNEEKLEDVKVKEKQSVTLTCEVTGRGQQSRGIRLSAMAMTRRGNPVPQISWQKDGQPLVEDEWHQVLSHGRFLQISYAQVADTGRYTCVASNTAGYKSKNFNLNVLVSPTIAGVDVQGTPEDVTVTLNSPTSLVCEAQSYPPATITWLKDGVQFESNRNIRVLPGGRTLQILNAQEEDAGRYTCIATNEAGETIKNYEVKVYTNGRILQIQKAQVSDTGRYTCVASNIAGEDEKDFDVNIQVPPSFQKPTGIKDTASVDSISGIDIKDVVINNPISLYCETNAVPPPTLTWYKDGKPVTSSDKVLILPGGRVLQIPRAQAEDAGRYTCVATNEAGEDSIQYDIRVLFPPSIRGADGDLPDEVTVLVNKTAMLECLVNGNPTPKISWLKDGQPLTESKTQKLLSNGRTLQVGNAQVTDTGRYVCVAENVAGSAEKYFNLNVHGNSESLEMHILSGGSKLQIARSQLSDSGTYTCVASNVEGKAHKNYFLTIQVPPNITGSEMSSEVSVLVNETVKLVCSAEGIPRPTIKWLKDGKKLNVTEARRIRVSPDGSTLSIIGVQTADIGKYTCVATNLAGEEDRIFNLNVYVPPSIQSNGKIPDELTAILDSSINIECVATGSPPPQLNWLKNGLPLPISSQIRLLSAGQVLRIVRAQVSDTGTYTCVASNRAGVDNKHYNLQVYVSPSLDNARGSEDVTVVRGNPTALLCISDGTPTPTLAWLKDGLPLQLSTQTTVLNQGMALQITQTGVEDTGRYTCIASNEAGEDSKHFNLQVLDPPRINGSDFPEEVSVIVNYALELLCISTGIPAPKLTWMKDGRPLPQTDGIRVLRGGEVLRIASAQVEDTGRYTCLASSPAGDDDKEFLVRVHVPPNIAGTSAPQDLSVLQNRQVILECKSDAVPPPSLTWLKDGEPLQNPRTEKYYANKLSRECMTQRGSFTLLPNGALQIARAKLEDAGTYMCVAQNPAGTALGKTKLRVQVPPVIVSQSKSYTVALDKSVPLLCEAQGYPAPEVIWHKDGHLVTESVRLRVLSSGALQITFAQPSDTGRYTCTVANVAGSSNIEMSLIVHVPPTIRSSETEYSVIESSQMVLPCVADGVPQPLISWQKEEVPLSDTLGKYTVMQSGELLVDNAQPDDTGSFTCVASNVVGQDSKTMSLTVHVHPAFTELLEDASLNKGERLMLSCGAVGVPTPRITWAFNNNIVPAQFDNVNGHSELVIERVSKDDSGTYACIAENSVGSIKSIGFVYVKEPPIIDGDFHSNRIEPLGGNAILNCEVRGDPPPTILWSKKGVNIQISNRIRQLDNGSLAIYGTVNEDGGSYMCIATNDAGMVERSVTLTLQSSPTVMVEPVETVVDAGTTVVLNCQADGEPPPTIEWSRQGRPLLGDDRITILSNNSLRLTRAQKEDTSEYECVARNLLGSVIVRVPVTVQVHGGFSEWLEWAPCSVTCGQGVQKRLRQCNNPLPANGGQHCLGADTETRSCQSKPCPGQFGTKEGEGYLCRKN